MKKHILTILKFGIVIAAVAYLIYSGKLDPGLIKIQPGKGFNAFIALLLVFIPCILAILRWYFLLHSLGNKLSFYRVMRLGFIGCFFNTFMFGAFGGDLVKIGYIVKETDQKAEAIASIFTDRICGLIGLLIIGGIAIAVNWHEVINTPSLHIMALTLFALLALLALCLITAIVSVIAGRKISIAVLAFLILSQAIFLHRVVNSQKVTTLTFNVHTAILVDLIIAVITAVLIPSLLPGGTLQGIVREKVPAGKKIMAFIDCFLAFRHKFGTLFIAVAISAFIQFLATLSIYFIALTIGNLAEISHVFFAAPATFIANVLPVPLGGLGIGEGVFDALLQLCRTNSGEIIKGGAVLFLAWRFLIILFGLVFGLPFYLSGKKEIDKIEEDYKRIFQLESKMTLEYAKEVLKAEVAAIESVCNNLGESFTKALNLIIPEDKTSHRIIACGIGKAGIIAQKAAATLASTGTEAVFMHPSDALHGDLGIVRKGDIALILSNSGESDEISRLLPFLRKHELKIIAVTSSTRSTLGVQADVVLKLGNLQEACPLGLAPTASTTAMLALGDALAMALMKRRDFTVSDYAKFHPAGELGRKSFTVAEVMRGEKAVAIVNMETVVSEVIKEISKARAGAGIVVDNDGKLLGIFTDGDLRRGIIEDSTILNQPVKNVMIEKPASINSDSSAAEALEIMRSKRIGEIPVTDKNNKAVGMIDLKGLLAEGIS